MSDTLRLVVATGSVLVALVTIATVTTLFALFPAYRAARMPPVTAIHHVG
jgi:ABC-type antimicrobial peptide transport system permease subunit